VYSGLFIQYLEEALGDTSLDTEIADSLSDLGATLNAFLIALDDSITTEELRRDNSLATLFGHPNSRLAREAFLLADIPAKIQILQTFSSTSNALFSITNNLAYLGGSRAEIDDVYGA